MELSARLLANSDTQPRRPFDASYRCTVASLIKLDLETWIERCVNMILEKVEFRMFWDAITLMWRHQWYDRT